VGHPRAGLDGSGEEKKSLLLPGFESEDPTGHSSITILTTLSPTTI